MSTGPDFATSELVLAYLPEEQEKNVPGRPWAAALDNLLDRTTTWWVCLGLMLGALLVPLGAVEVPPLTDYPNHLAR